MQQTPVRTVFDVITDFLAAEPTPEELIAYHLPDDLQARVDALVERNGEGQLTFDEQQELLDFITCLNRDRHTTIILVVHQISLAANRANKLAIINKDKNLFAVGPAEQLLSGERLTDLYSYPIEIVEAGDALLVRASGRKTEGQ